MTELEATIEAEQKTLQSKQLEAEATKNKAMANVDNATSLQARAEADIAKLASISAEAILQEGEHICVLIPTTTSSNEAHSTTTDD